jgi:hypothetical protein
MDGKRFIRWPDFEGPTSGSEVQRGILIGSENF